MQTNMRGVATVGLAVVLFWLALGAVAFNGIQTTSNNPKTYPGQYQERPGNE